MKKDYNHFMAEDFMLDDDFIRWVLSTSNHQQDDKDSFLHQYPEKKEEIEAAGLLIRKLAFEKQSSPAGARQKVWQHLQQSIRQQEQKRTFRLPRYRQAAAAIFIGLLLLGGYWTWNTLNHVTVRTAYGEVKTIELPDHSAITLNAHSFIRYNKDWSGNKTREVWLEGEAFFRVSHAGTNNNSTTPFIVHTDNLNVEVLGTTFNVNDRHETTTVVLQSGKVRLDFKQKDRPEVVMKPGEIVKYENGNKIVRSNANVNHFTSWTSNKLEFDNTPLRKVIRMIHDNYGYTVEMEDTSLASKTLSGTISTKSEAVLLKGIATSLGITIKKENDHTLIITGK